MPNDVANDRTAAPPVIRLRKHVVCVILKAKAYDFRLVTALENCCTGILLYLMNPKLGRQTV